MKKFIFVIFVLLLSSTLFSQERLTSVEEDYFDFLSLQNIIQRPTLGYRTLSDSVWENDNKQNENLNSSQNPWADNNLSSVNILFQNECNDNWFLNGIFTGLKFKVFGPEWFNSYNTKLPYGQNDGSLWQGVGYNTSLTSGIKLFAYGFELTLKPQVDFSQNKPFDFLNGVYGNNYSYFDCSGGGIDLVQRYGDDSFWQIDLGDSEIRWSLYSFTMGFGTQTPWLGPAKLNPMLGSNNAAGYLKFDIGFRKTDIIIPGIDLNIGKFETRIWMGQLKESKYFDNDESNNRNLINGFNISFSPAFLPQFTLGATKVCVTKWNGDFIKYMNPFYSANDLNGPGEDQKASIYTDFFFPSVGFDCYLEYGIDDYPADFLANPFHTGILTFGIEKTISLGKKAESIGVHSLLLFECNLFEMSQDFQLEWPYTGYYSHSKITQGYTNNGQIIGAGSGYFGNSQLLKYSVYYPKGQSSLIIQRDCPNSNYIYNKTIYSNPSETNPAYFDCYTYYLTLGLNSTYFITKSLYVDGTIKYIRVGNYCYNGNYTINNFKFDLTLKYNF